MASESSSSVEVDVNSLGPLFSKKIKKKIKTQTSNTIIKTEEEQKKEEEEILRIQAENEMRENLRIRRLNIFTENYYNFCNPRITDSYHTKLIHDTKQIIAKYQNEISDLNNKIGNEYYNHLTNTTQVTSDHDILCMKRDKVIHCIKQVLIKSYTSYLLSLNYPKKDSITELPDLEIIYGISKVFQFDFN
jgi:hypothetical protein